MKFHLLAAACLISLAACQPESTTTQSPAVPGAGTAVVAEACPDIPTGYQFLPEPLEIPVAYHLRADRIYADKNGQSRRRVVLEFLEGDADSALTAVEQVMLDAGFKARPRKTAPNGKTVAPYVKKGATNITVTVNPHAGDNPFNPLAMGLLTYEYPLALASKKEEAEQLESGPANAD